MYFLSHSMVDNCCDIITIRLCIALIINVVVDSIASFRWWAAALKALSNFEGLKWVVLQSWNVVQSFAIKWHHYKYLGMLRCCGHYLRSMPVWRTELAALSACPAGASEQTRMLSPRSGLQQPQPAPQWSRTVQCCCCRHQFAFRYLCCCCDHFVVQASR